ncbi:MAG TPA: Wzz/FepE/Etk N-terminal domain-containing protein, partial [Phycicoccus sp.]|nr:Wzz/FepE/Etk N-terminal domain-containing protein [Phycicoccus sp.]HQY97264.1 Wzz/FepE/Etk N-terminal domain-containing protein [Phycicoccus sp.]HRA44203.1 Wzz/FepE/Etk N-terminal domain-containing protein [Phycicoccus sp.]
MTLIEFVRLSRANLWKIVLATVVGYLLAYGYASTLPKVYTADASGYIVTNSGAKTIGDLYAGSALAGSKADSYLPLVTSRSVSAMVIKQLKLDADPASVAGRVTGSVEPSSAILRVFAVGPTPEQARDVADATIQATA